MNENKTRGFEVCNEYKEKNIKLPERKTKCSVGYDIEAADDTLVPSIWKIIFKNFGKYITGSKDYEEIKPTLINTGLKSYFLEDEILVLANKSSLPFKKGLVMANSIGIIESDYYGNESNDGHLMYSYYNFSPIDLNIKKGEVIGQAYFQKFLIADGDNATGKRIGGYGSTSK